MMMATLSMGRAVTSWGYTVGTLVFRLLLFCIYIFTIHYYNSFILSYVPVNKVCSDLKSVLLDLPKQRIDSTVCMK